MSCRIIAYANHKGGVGKTTSVVNLGAGLHKLGKRVLLVDMDPQSNLTLSLGIKEPERNIYGSMRGKHPLEPVEILPGLDLVPSTLDLSGAEVELSGETGREYILRELLEPLRTKYQFILTDCPPSLGLLTLNALTASQEVMIPIQAHFLALQGLSKLMEIIEKIQKRLNKELRVSGVFITLYDGRKVLNREIVASLETYFKAELCSTKIRDNIALAEAPVNGLDIFRYSPRSYGAEDYLALTREILKKSNKVNRVIL